MSNPNTSFSSFDAGQQTDTDLFAKIKQAIDNGATEVYLHNLSVSADEEPVYSAHVLWVIAAQ